MEQEIKKAPQHIKKIFAVKSLSAKATTENAHERYTKPDDPEDDVSKATRPFLAWLTVILFMCIVNAGKPFSLAFLTSFRKFCTMALISTLVGPRPQQILTCGLRTQSKESGC